MLLHALNLLIRSLSAIPNSLGSTWLGIVFPIAVGLLGETIGVFLYGWNAMIQNWKKATGIAFASLGVGFTVLFIFCLVSTIYSDHTYLVSISNRLSERLSESKNGVQGKIEEAIKSKDSQIGQLKLDCAQNIGVANQMRTQLADEQRELTTCLIQQKEVPLVRVFPISPDQRPEEPKMEYLLVTNTVHSPVDILASCDLNMADVSVTPLTTTLGSVNSTKKNRLSATAYKVSILSPAWSPSGPLWATIFFVPPVNRMPSCSFTTG